MSLEMIRKILRIDLLCVFRSRANAEELELLLRVIDHNDFSTLPDDCSRREEGRSLVPGRRGCWVATCFIILTINVR